MTRAMVGTTGLLLLSQFTARRTRRRALSVLGAFSICLGLAGCGRPDDQIATGDGSTTQSDIFGKVIHFDATHEAEPYKVSGWSGTETNFTWTEGKAAVLALPIPANAGRLRLRVLVSAYTHPPELPSQSVEVYANGRKVAAWEVANPADNVAEIPGEITAKSTTLTIQFRTPKATAPAAFSAKPDPRVLGICCHEMELTKVATR